MITIALGILLAVGILWLISVKIEGDIHEFWTKPLEPPQPYGQLPEIPEIPEPTPTRFDPVVWEAWQEHLRLYRATGERACREPRG